jgi:hypothetical protein
MNGTLADDIYVAAVEALYEQEFRPRMVKLLTRWADAAKAEGYDVSGPYDLSDDDFRWCVTLRGNGIPEEDEAVDVSLEIAESLEYEGSIDGINFGLDIVAYGGEVIGGLTPYNYSDHCWVPLDEPEQLSGRLKIIEDADIGAGLGLIADWKERKA